MEEENKREEYSEQDLYACFVNEDLINARNRENTYAGWIIKEKVSGRPVAYVVVQSHLIDWDFNDPRVKDRAKEVVKRFVNGKHEEEFNVVATVLTPETTVFRTMDDWFAELYHKPSSVTVNIIKSIIRWHYEIALQDARPQQEGYRFRLNGTNVVEVIGPKGKKTSYTKGGPGVWKNAKLIN